MRIRPLVGIIVLIAVSASVWPAAVDADHGCPKGKVSPRTGVPGTTFVFTTNLGDSVDVRVRHNGELVASDFIRTAGRVRYEVSTGPGDGGTWSVSARLRSSPEWCLAGARFSVVGLPQTSTVTDAARDFGGGPMPASTLVLGLAALLGFGVSLRLMSRRPTP